MSGTYAMIANAGSGSGARAQRVRNGIAVVPIAQEHIPSFHGGVDQVARERRYFAMLEAPPLEELTRAVCDNLAQDNPHFVALDGSTVVGWCDITRMVKRAVFAHRGTLGIGVLPAYRGRGLGRELLDAALARARATGFVRVELHVRVDNLPAIALYRRFGFNQEGRLRDALLVDGRFHDLLCMAVIWRPHARVGASR